MPGIPSKRNGSGRSSSLDPLETNEHARLPETRAQRMLHARHERPRWHVIDSLNASGDTDLERRADRMHGCCQCPRINVDQNGKPLLALQCCRDRLCPRCQVDRGRVAALRITELAKSFNAPRFITLTLKHRNASLASELDRLSAAFKAVRRHAGWKRHVKGGAYAVQVTRNPSTGLWHVHLHLIVEGTYWPQDQLSKAWLAATGDSPVVDIQAIPDRAATARYVATYVTKPNSILDWPAAAVCEYAEAMHGRRTLHTFGCAHGQSIDPPEDPDAPKSAESLCAIAKLQRFADRGHDGALHVLEILSRMGPTYRAAVGRPPLLFTGPLEPVADWELAVVVSVSREISEVDEADRFKPQKPPPEPTTPEPPEQSRLWEPTPSSVYTR